MLLPIAAATFDAARWLGGECGQPPGRSVIVVETRFMQGQGRFRALVGARLEQMLAVTVPSMAAQTNRCFVWLVSTDPALPAGPRRRLEAALPAHARLVDAPRGVDATYAPGGNVTSLLAAAFPGLRARLAAADELTLITLDADDALHRSYVQHVARWRRSAPPLSAAATFDYACANRAMAWLSSKDVGARARRSADAEVRQFHAVYLETLPRGCLMSGLAHALALVGGDLRACAPAPCPVLAGAGNARDAPRGSALGRVPLVYCWTSDHPSERSRRVHACSGTRARGKPTSKRSPVSGPGPGRRPRGRTRERNSQLQRLLSRPFSTRFG